MEVLVSKGFLVVAQNTESTDYVRQAYALALSIKSSQTSYTDISIMTNDEVSDEYASVFDKVVKIPWDDAAVDSLWKVENRWKIYYATPYDETIVLDTDMLVLEDITPWWDYCSSYSIKFCSSIKNYKLEKVVDTYHRKAFVDNKLSSPYFALHYFKKDEVAYNFYKMLEFVSNNWEWCYTKCAPKSYQNWLSMDLAAAIAIELTGINQIALDKVSPLEFIHMKPAIQGWDNYTDLWCNTVPVVLNTRGDLVVGNIKQSKIFHYVNDEFLTSTILERLKELANGKTQ